MGCRHRGAGDAIGEPAVEMNAEDMARMKLVDGDLVTVTSRRGDAVLMELAGVTPFGVVMVEPQTLGV